MSVETLIEDVRWEALGIETLAEVAAGATLEAVGLDADQWDIDLLACDDARISALNADFRGKPQPTNVLSWPSEERGAAMPGEMPLPPDPMDPGLGDIAISYDTCAREAEAQGLSLTDHATHLIVHGTLHLLGYDHERDGDAALMEGLEREILGQMGLHDPYRDDGTPP